MAFTIFFASLEVGVRLLFATSLPSDPASPPSSFQGNQLFFTLARDQMQYSLSYQKSFPQDPNDLSFWSQPFKRDNSSLSTIEVPKRGFSHSFQVTTDSEGRRKSGHFNAADGGTEVFLFGCSYVFGSGVSDDETFASQIQKNRPDLKVINFGQPGQAVTANALHLRATEARPGRPGKAIYFFSRDHLSRTDGTKSLYNRTPFPMVRNDFMDPQLESYESSLKVPIRFLFDHSFLMRLLVPLVGNHLVADEDFFLDRLEALRRLYWSRTDPKNDFIVYLLPRPYGAFPGEGFKTKIKDRGFTLVDRSHLHFRDLVGDDFYIPYDVHPNSKSHTWMANDLLNEAFSP